MPEQPIILSVITQVLASTSDDDLMSLLKTVQGVTQSIILRHEANLYPSDIIEKREWKEYAPDIPNETPIKTIAVDCDEYGLPLS